MLPSRRKEGRGEADGPERIERFVEAQASLPPPPLSRQ